MKGQLWTFYRLIFYQSNTHVHQFGLLHSKIYVFHSFRPSLWRWLGSARLTTKQQISKHFPLVSIKALHGRNALQTLAHHALIPNWLFVAIVIFGYRTKLLFPGPRTYSVFPVGATILRNITSGTIPKSFLDFGGCFSNAIDDEIRTGWHQVWMRNFGSGASQVVFEVWIVFTAIVWMLELWFKAGIDDRWIQMWCIHRKGRCITVFVISILKVRLSWLNKLLLLLFWRCLAWSVVNENHVAFSAVLETLRATSIHKHLSTACNTIHVLKNSRI